MSMVKAEFVGTKLYGKASHMGTKCHVILLRNVLFYMLYIAVVGCS